MVASRFLARAVIWALPLLALASQTASADEIGRQRLVKIGSLKPTFYWVAMEEVEAAEKNKELKDMEGNVMARVTAKFDAAIRMEGTGKMLDGRVLNFAGRGPKEGGGLEVRFLVCPPEAPYGYGLDFIPLVPFRSVAVDPNVVKIGTKIYIPKAKGTPLPDGTLHDGYFMAVDIGSAIQNKRIDIFTSYGDQSDVFENYGLSNMKAVDVYRVEE